jgi:serine/threonine protein phosphatase PrpC
MFPGGALAVVIDGLGHGKDACEAASSAERILRADPGAAVTELVQRCHEALRGTRGVVMSIASFDARAATMTWLGVGNVEGLLVRRAPEAGGEAVAQRGGTVGYLLPTLVPRTLQVAPGDTLVLATDGISGGFKSAVRQLRSAQEIADEILHTWGKSTDDACVLVARFLGAPTEEASA